MSQVSPETAIALWVRLSSVTKFSFFLFPLFSYLCQPRFIVKTTLWREKHILNKDILSYSHVTVWYVCSYWPRFLRISKRARSATEIKKWNQKDFKKSKRWCSKFTLVKLIKFWWVQRDTDTVENETWWQNEEWSRSGSYVKSRWEKKKKRLKQWRKDVLKGLFLGGFLGKRKTRITFFLMQILFNKMVTIYKHAANLQRLGFTSLTSSKEGGSALNDFQPICSTSFKNK